MERSNVFQVETTRSFGGSDFAKWFGLAAVLLCCWSAPEKIDPLDLNKFGILLREPFVRDGPVEIFAFFQW